MRKRGCIVRRLCERRDMTTIAIKISDTLKITVAADFELTSQGRRRESGVMIPVISMTKNGVADIFGSYGLVKNHPQVKSAYGQEGFGPVSTGKIEAAIKSIRCEIEAHNEAIYAEVARADAHTARSEEIELINS
jgi:hypothetical protein